MRLAIVNITGGGISGGYRKYLINMIPKLASSQWVDGLLCASPASIKAEDWIVPLPKVSYVRCRPFNVVNELLFQRVDSQLKEHLDKFSPDVLFIPVDRYINYNNVPVVSMIRNMEPFIGRLEGDLFINRLKKIVQYYVVKRAVKRAHGIVAVSNYVRDFLINHWDISKDKITLIYHGDGFLMQIREEHAPPLIPQDWKGRFIFTSGSICPARGLEDVLLAMKYLTQGIDLKGLVVAGDAAPYMARYREKLETWVKAHNLSSMVCWAGHLDESQMAWCYKNCSIFVMTSRVESFGAVALEAMSSGCVSIAADNPCLPEIFGDAAVFYPPRDGRALSEKIRMVLCWSEKKKDEMSAAAQNRALKFSWEVNAEKIVTVLLKAMKLSGKEGNFKIIEEDHDR
jgi:glycosyltransferase involved in cell wall biosynthesis